MAAISSSVTAPDSYSRRRSGGRSARLESSRVDTPASQMRSRSGCRRSSAERLAIRPARCDLAGLIASLSADDRLQPLLDRICEAGVSTRLDSSLADLPPDLRRLYESGAVTLEEMAAIHARLQ